MSSLSFFFLKSKMPIDFTLDKKKSCVDEVCSKVECVVHSLFAADFILSSIIFITKIIVRSVLVCISFTLLRSTFSQRILSQSIAMIVYRSSELILKKETDPDANTCVCISVCTRKIQRRDRRNEKHATRWKEWKKEPEHFKIIFKMTIEANNWKWQRQCVLRDIS